jgi:hypothetical protein
MNWKNKKIQAVKEIVPQKSILDNCMEIWLKL